MEKDKEYTLEFDTCVCIVNGDTISNDKNDENESGWFLEKVEKSGVKYKVLDPEGPGGGWPLIQYTGTIEQLNGLLPFLDPCGRDYDEIAELLQDFDGTDEELNELFY